MNETLNTKTRALLERLVATGEEVGLQTAATLDGQLIVDAWAGLADETTGRPVDGDTLFTSWSTTKGFVATCLHILADRGVVDYDTAVAHYWPGFAAHGKDKTTVRDALTHRCGVPQMPDGVTPEMMTDWDAMCAAIAGHEPLWTPGTKVGYHAWTFGWIIGEIVRRADGRPIAQFAQEELCQPLGLEGFYLGIPDAVEGRVARLRNEPAPPGTAKPSELNLRAMPAHVTSARTVNRPDVRRASIPGGGGIMNARAIARHYAMLAGGGELDGVRVLSAERIDTIRALQTDAYDLVLDKALRRGLGYFLGGSEEAGGAIAMGRSGRAFGHPGLGGSLGFADPERGLAFGLTKTLLKAGQEKTEAAAYLVAELIREEI